MTRLVQCSICVTLVSLSSLRLIEKRHHCTDCARSYNDKRDALDTQIAALHSYVDALLYSNEYAHLDDDTYHATLRSAQAELKTLFAQRGHLV